MTSSNDLPIIVLVWVDLNFSFGESELVGGEGVSREDGVAVAVWKKPAGSLTAGLTLLPGGRIMVSQFCFPIGRGEGCPSGRFHRGSEASGREAT